MKPRNGTGNKAFARLLAALGCPVALCLILLVWIFAPAPVRAACPTGSSSLYLPTPAGSQPDLLYSLLPASWHAGLGEPLLVTYLPGRGGSYAASRLLDEDDNGCSLAGVVLPSLFLLSETSDRMYDPGDLGIAAVLAGAPVALWVAENSPFRNLADLVIFARAENEKAEGVFAVAGTGRYTDQHLAALVFDRAAGVKSLYLPVLGSAEAVAAVQSGKASACWGYALSRETMPGLRALGVSGERRSPVLPEVPTFREVQVDMVEVSHFALAVRATMPEESLRQLRASLEGLLSDQELRGQMAARGFIPLALGPQDIDAFLEGRKRGAEQSLADYLLIPRQSRR